MIALRPDTLSVINQVAQSLAVDVDLVKAIVMIESAGNTYATRFEKAWKNFFFVNAWASKLQTSVDTETVHQMTSWGLMQVIGAVAREMGFTEDLPKLCDPAIGLFYGCKKLKQLSQRYSLESDVISAYNAGSVLHKIDSNFYVNEAYVDKVYKTLRELRKLQ